MDRKFKVSAPMLAIVLVLLCLMVYTCSDGGRDPAGEFYDPSELPQEPVE